MYQHILIATDGSELAEKAVSAGLNLAKALNARVLAVTVSEAWAAYAAPEIMMPYPNTDYERFAAEQAEKILSSVAKSAAAIGVQCATLHVSDRYPADGIVDAAKDRGCDLIVMASHGRRGLARLLLGSQAMQVLTHSPVPVLICR